MFLAHMQLKKKNSVAELAWAGVGGEVWGDSPGVSARGAFELGNELAEAASTVHNPLSQASSPGASNQKITEASTQVFKRCAGRSPTQKAVQGSSFYSEL